MCAHVSRAVGAIYYLLRVVEDYLGEIILIFD